MQNTKTFQKSFSNSESPARNCFRLTERPDAPQAAKNLKKPEGNTLEARLRSLDAMKKDYLEKNHKENLQSLARIENLTLGKMLDNVHTLNERHKREVGTAVKIAKNQYLLVHASQEAVELILSEHKGKSADVLKSELTKLGIVFDPETYTKAKIPTAKPISEILESREKVSAQPIVSPDVTAVQSSSERIASLSKLEIASPIDILSGKNKIQHEVTLSRLYGGEKNIPPEVSRVFNFSGEIDVKQLQNPKYVKKVLGSFFRAGSTNEFQAKVREAQKSLDSSSAEFQSLQEVLAVFKVMDITYGNIAGGSPEKRLARMDKSVEQLPGLKNFDAQRLFADKKAGIGVYVDWQDFYDKNSKAESPQSNNSNKAKLASILDGGEVQMLRVDRSKHSGKQFEAFIDGTPGAALKNSLDTPLEIRGEKNYVYKYKALLGSPAEAAIANYRKHHPELEKYLQGLTPTEIAQSFQVAQVEIPNCENPAIVVKPNFKEKQILPTSVATPEESKCEETLTLLRAFKNRPNDLLKILRPLDWFASAEESNALADPAIFDLADGKVLRESEYLNAEKRLGIHIETPVNDQVAEIAGKKPKFDPQSQNYFRKQNPAEFFTSKIEIHGVEKPVIEAAQTLARDLENRVNVAASGEKDWKMLTKKAEAVQDWRKTNQEILNRQVIQLAEFMYNESLNKEKLENHLVREKTAAELLKFQQDYRQALTGQKRKVINFNKGNQTADETFQTFSELKKYGPSLYKKLIENLVAARVISDESSAEDLSHKNINQIINSALYNREYLNIKHPPQFLGDFVVDTALREDQINVHYLRSELSKELRNVDSPIGHMLKIATALSGYLIYIKTGVGIPRDLPEEYKEMIQKITLNKGNPNAIMSADEYTKFKQFIEKQTVDCGNKVISIPLDEVRLLIPGYHLLAGWMGVSGGGGSCPSVSAGGSTGGGSSVGGLG